MKQPLFRWTALGGLLAAAGVVIPALFSGPGYAEDKSLSLRWITTEYPSSFPPLLFIQVFNSAYRAADLADWVAASELIVDGKPSRRSSAPFHGPQGLPAKGSWQGCLSPVDYAPPISRGLHKISLKMGQEESNDVKVEWHDPVNWRQGTRETRFKEAGELTDALQNLPRSCVEQWLPREDGGTQEPNRIRYYLAPGIKVVVPYSRPGGLENDQQVVNGAVQIYEEPIIAD